MNKKNNNLLALGISILVLGLMLLSYSISSYTELKSLDEKMNFDELDNNVQMSTTDKYYRYLSNSDFLTQKLNKNKDLLFKNSTCVYLDYAEHNAVSLYELTYNGVQTDDSRKDVAAGNLRSLLKILDNYRTCKQSSTYKDELKHILDDIEKSDSLYSNTEERMNNFMNGYNNSISVQSQQLQENAAIAGDSYSSNQTDTQNVYTTQPIQSQQRPVVQYDPNNPPPQIRH